jgi:hypothetical protein
VRSLKFDPAAFENLAWWIARDRKIALRPSCPTRSRSRDSASPSRSSTSQVLPTELLVGGRRRTLQALDRWPKVVLEHALDRRQDVGCYVVGLVPPSCRSSMSAGGGRSAWTSSRRSTTASNWQTAAPRAACARATVEQAEAAGWRREEAAEAPSLLAAGALVATGYDEDILSTNFRGQQEVTSLFNLFEIGTDRRAPRRVTDARGTD